MANALPRAVALVPTRNAESFVDATLRSLAAQTYPRFEVLVSDDASTDATATICERFAAGDSRFRVLRQEHRLGWVGNTNALLRAADGEYQLFACHDDLLAPTYVACLVDELERDSGAVLAFSDGEIVQLDGRVEGWSFTELDGIHHRLERAVTIVRQPLGWAVPYHGLFRASAAARIGGLRRHRAGEFGADWPWLLRMSLRGGFVRVAERLFRKVCYPQGLARSWGSSAWGRLGVTLACVGEVHRAGLLPKEGIRLQAELSRSCARFLLSVIRRRCSRGARRFLTGG
jgi:glycosyltransferase involved in cell wall biosynthesis